MEQITKEELLDVTGKFELGNHIEVVSVEPYGSGHINDTFRLEVKEKSERTDGQYFTGHQFSDRKDQRAGW